MSLELLSALGTWVTAIIIGATAVAALIQLRHIRASNELTAFSEAWDLWFSAPVQNGFAFIQRELKTRMEDPAFRRELDSPVPVDHAEHPELNVADFLDNIGVMVVLGLMREETIMQPGSQLLVEVWATLAPGIAIMRRKRGAQLYVSFEYLEMRARLGQKRFPDGYQRNGWQRVALADPWLTADTGIAQTK
jgi:hypothetical protein